MEIGPSDSVRKQDHSIAKTNRDPLLQLGNNRVIQCCIVPRCSWICEGRDEGGGVDVSKLCQIHVNTGATTWTALSKPKYHVAPARPHDEAVFASFLNMRHSGTQSVMTQGFDCRTEHGACHHDLPTPTVHLQACLIWTGDRCRAACHAHVVGPIAASSHTA
eukprot:m.890209 g.890209  ORF g.890209 m.890209 type:complete len:162 (+) comp23649_c0_seq5:1916-2401(+)